MVESRRSGFKDGLFSFYGHLSFYSLRFSLFDLRTAQNGSCCLTPFLVCPKKVADLTVGKSRSEINYIYLFLDQAGNRHVLKRLFILSAEEKQIHLTFLVH